MYDQAIENYSNLKHIYNKGLLKCSLDERIDSLIDILKNLGAVYMEIAEYKKSMESFQEALQLLTKLKVQKTALECRQARIHYNMGLVFRKIGNTSKV